MISLSKVKNDEAFIGYRGRPKNAWNLKIGLEDRQRNLCLLKDFVF